MFVELSQVRDEILYNVGVGERINSGFVGGLGWDATYRLLETIIAKSAQYVHKQASVLTPSMFIAQLPHMPSLQLRRNVKVGSTSFLMRIKASNIIGPVLFKSNVYDCIFGFSLGVSGDQRYMWNVLILASASFLGSWMVEVCFSEMGGCEADVASANLDIGSTVA